MRTLGRLADQTARILTLPVRDETTTELVVLARSGDQAALEALIERYQGRVAGFVYAMIGNDAAVEDLCQTAFMRMVSGLAALKSPESFESWLMRLARNVCVDHLRRERLRRLFVPFSREHEQVAEQPATPEEARLASLRRAVLGLPVRQRELVALLQEQELSYEELARITRSTVSSVKSRLFRAREELKRRTRDES